MNKISLRQRAYKYLKGRPGQWINGGELERLAMEAGYKGSTVSRELRRLAEESYDNPVEDGGFILRQEKTGKRVRSVWYCWVDKKTPEVERQQMLEQNAEMVRREFPEG